MTDKHQAILLKLIVELKKKQWIATPDWQITLQSEKLIPLKKYFPVIN